LTWNLELIRKGKSHLLVILENNGGIEMIIGDLEFDDEFFDIIINVDSYHYYGHEKEYLDKHLAPLLKKGGRILATMNMQNGILR
jgi:cyclopropane fatty-acyl-phospholipid synthase-like methyltransferase